MKPFLLICLLLLASCYHHDDNINCTTEYRMLTVTVVDSVMRPVLLDSSFTRKTSTGEIINFSQEDPWYDSTIHRMGTYLLYTDGQMYQTTPEGEEFTFHGYLGAAEVINEPYIIAHDRCHVVKVSGRDTLVTGSPGHQVTRSPGK